MNKKREERDWGFLLVGVTGMVIITSLMILFNILQYNPIIGNKQGLLLSLNFIVSIIVLVYSIYLINKK